MLTAIPARSRNPQLSLSPPSRHQHHRRPRCHPQLQGSRTRHLQNAQEGHTRLETVFLSSPLQPHPNQSYPISNPRISMEGVFVTGLQGKLSADTTLRLPDGQQARLKKDESWIIRWDCDPSKLSRVNAAFGKSGRRFAFQPSPSHMGSGSQPYFGAIINQYRSINYNAPTWKPTGLFGASKKDKNKDLAAKELARQWATWYGAPTSNYPTVMSDTHPGFDPRRWCKKKKRRVLAANQLALKEQFLQPGQGSRVGP